MVIESSPPRVFDIPEDEDERTPCSSGSVHSIDFGFLVGEAVPNLSSEDDEIDEVYLASEFRDYLADNPHQAIPRPSQVREESNFKAKELKSVVYKAYLFIYCVLFKVPTNIHFWIPGEDDRADLPLEGCVAMNYDTIITRV